MPSKSLISSTSTSVVPFGGVLQELFTTHLDPAIPLDEISDVEVTSIDEDDDGRPLFLTDVKMTTYLPDRLPPEAWHRLACYLLINKLTDESLVTAYEELLDIYSWQGRRERLRLPETLTQNRVVTANIKKIERKPFDIE
jgi:hypothetical protein